MSKVSTPHRALIAGVDEAGRGPLAGPVVAAAVVLDPANAIAGLRDSKTLSEKRRAALDADIRSHALCWSLGLATVAEIDRLNIHHATLLAMRRAVLALQRVPGGVLVDGKFVPDLPIPARAEVGGDGRIGAISAASILAKQARDEIMRRLHNEFPRYGFDIHKGYPTRAHREAITRFGVAACHRRSFGPVRRMALEGGDE
ncbi:MAG: ribonuclease HII [Proteobacteria bacterium]|nr:MAG: ribonuclease HII [Pseudomonadota bacterium]